MVFSERKLICVSTYKLSTHLCHMFHLKFQDRKYSRDTPSLSHLITIKSFESDIESDFQFSSSSIPQMRLSVKEMKVKESFASVFKC